MNLFSLLDWTKIAGGAALGALLAYQVGHWRGDASGYARYAAEQTKATLRAEKLRNRDDAELQRLSDYDFCVRSLADRGMPISACERLRGLSEE